LLVLDYIKKLRGSKLVVPPFHTGHLGLLPGTQVSIGVMMRTEAPRHCELVISPFDRDTEETALIKCKLHDMIGVVGRLTEAISVLGINILKEESSSIDHLKHHSISFLVDMSDKRLDIAHPSTRNLYSDYASVFPTHDYRYVEIFESIIGHVGDAIVWREVSGNRYPELSIEPLDHIRLRIPRTARVQEHESRSVSIPLPSDLLSKLRFSLDRNQASALHYILLSETEQRTLRAFFPQPETIRNIVHLGFYHHDEPSELLPIISALAAAEFNVLTSLLRKQTSTMSVWEAVLEYRGKDRIPSESEWSGWVGQKIEVAAANLNRTHRSDFEIGSPKYPPSEGLAHVKVTLPKTQRKTKRKRDALLPQLDKRRGDLTGISENLGFNKEDVTNSKNLLRLVEKRIRKGPKKIIFLSYSKPASNLARQLKRELKKRYTISEYQEGDGEIILQRTTEMIHSSDYFIGIWHKDERLRFADGKFHTSPWLPIEHGIALSAPKVAFIAYSEDLNSEILNRIKDGIAKVVYQQDTFAEVTIPKILRFCAKHFK